LVEALNGKAELRLHRPLPQDIAWQMVETKSALKGGWTHGSDLCALAGRPVRLRFAFNDADLFSLRFAD
jgi:hypothetical protein